MKKGPPKLGNKLLKAYCKQELYEEIEGDISEEYYQVLKEKGTFLANLYYYRQVLSFIKPFAIKKKIKSDNTMPGLFKNYIKVSLRSIRKDKINFAISSLGLCVALTSAIIIYLVTRFETTYDQFNSKADRIFRINYDGSADPSRNYVLPTVGPPLGPAIKAAYPEVEDAVRFRTTRSTIVKTPDGRRSFYEDKVVYADPSIFNIFDFPLREGDPKTALSQPNNIVLTEGFARKYFGDMDPMGKVLIYGNEPFQVTGILNPIPANNHFYFDAILPFKAFKVPYGYPVTLDDWGWISFYVYILMDEKADYKGLESKLPAFASKHFGPERSAKMRYRVQPLKDIYFGNVKAERIASGNYTYIIILYSVGFMLLLLAGFNFTNLAAAAAISKAKETGLRKTLGTSKFSLWIRYLAEPVITCTAGTLIALIVVPSIMPFVNQSFGLAIPLPHSYWTIMVPICLSIGLVLGILAGVYPALVMIRFKPAIILKGSFMRSNSCVTIRRVLVTIQFAITSFLIFGSLIISSQINFLHNKDLGYDRDNIILMRIPEEISTASYRQLRNSLLQNPGIENVSVGGGRMDREEGNVPIYVEGKEDPINLSISAVRENFFATIGAKMIAGREFSFDHPSDTLNAIIINEEAAKTFGWTPTEAIGKHIRVFDLNEGNVIGVVKNYNSTSLHNSIAPIVISYPSTHLRDLYVRISSANKADIITSLETKFHTLFPGIPFDYIFMNDNLKKLYKSDIQFEKLVNIFSMITIFISILGLYGLIALVSQQRIKEVTIRKILGANFITLISTLSGSFIWLIIAANVIACPISFFIAGKWINSFAYRTEISVIFFILPLIITILLAAIILIYQSSKIAIINPVKTLRYE